MSTVAETTKHMNQSIREQFAGQLRSNQKQASSLSPLLRLVTVCLGCSLIVAAMGIWLVPGEDPAMHLLKLGASVFLFGLGAIALFFEKDTRDPRRVEFDAVRRQLRTYQADESGKLALDGQYDLDSFAEVSLRDGVLFGRDPANGVVISVPVRSRSKEAAIRKAMKLV